MDDARSAEWLIRPLDTGRCVAIEIIMSSVMLKSPKHHCDSGKLYIHPSPSVAPGAKNCTVFIKKDSSVFGSDGVLTYQLGTNQSSRLAIMFSNPFWRASHFRTFALHITQSEASEEELYKGLDNHRALLEHCKKATGDPVRNRLTLVHNEV